MIVTVKPEEVTEELAKRMVRGMTLLPSVGGYSKTREHDHDGHHRYEMYDLDQIVHEIDDDAFINILPTHSVFGRFANENEQKCIEQLAYCQK